MLSLVVGSTTQASSCVVGAFIGGLAIGAVIGGKLSDKVRYNQLLLYGAIELLTAVVAPVISWILANIPESFAAVSRMLPGDPLTLTLERLGLASIVLLLPTIMMGATLPIVVSLATKIYAKPAHYFSMLYALNTLGGACGSLVAAFFSFPYLGVIGTILLAASTNLILGIAAIVLSRSLNGADVEVVKPEVPKPTSGNELEVSWRWFGIVAVFLGVTALSYEMLWIRLLHAFILGSTYVFTAMVSTFLIGLVAGSFIYNRKLAKDPDFIDNPGKQLSLLALSQYGAALASIIGLLILPGVMILRAAFDAVEGYHYITWLQIEFIISFLLMIFPATFIGLSFPLIAGVAATRQASTGMAVGNIYALNSLGCIAGSIGCGLILIPLIGSQYALELIAVCTVSIAIYIDYREGGKRWKRMCLIGLPIFLAVLFIPGQYLEKTHAGLMSSTLLKTAEDAIGRCSFISNINGKRLFVNGTSYSADSMPPLRYMNALAYFPILLHPQPKRALVVCFGIGTTAGAMASYPGLEHLDICEISPAVLSGASIFSETNYDVYKNPKVKIILEDGRNYLLRTEQKYDIISFEPPPPCDAGINNLYSREFYQLCKQHLNPGGILSQWVPMHTESAALWKMMTRTPLDVFSYVTLWQPSGLEAIILASDAPFKFDLKQMRERIEDNVSTKTCLERVSLDDEYKILATLMLSSDDFRNRFKNCASVTDDNGRLEFFLPYDGDMMYPSDLEKIQSNIQLLCTDANAGCDRVRLQKALEAMHIVRSAVTTRFKTGDIPATKESYKKALELFPQDKFIGWMFNHPDVH